MPQNLGKRLHPPLRRGIPGSLNDEVSEDDCRFVYDVLDMHRDLIRSYEALTDKAGIEAADVSFRGFDGNNEPELYGLISFLKGQGLWEETRGQVVLTPMRNLCRDTRRC